MRIYVDLVFGLNFCVDFLLLMGTNRLCGFPVSWKRCALAGALGGVYAAVCLVPEVSFLGNTLWRVVFLGLMGAAAYGFSFSAGRRILVFVLLTMALGGFAAGLGKNDLLTLTAAAGGVFLLCFLGFRNGVGQRLYVPVRLRCDGKQLQLLALRDTGNTLRDPVSGESVLVLGADAAQRLTGLTRQQLASPVETLASGCRKGLRLLPYRAVGQAGGMLLALRMDSVVINGKNAGTLVAFAPEGLDMEGTYQALVGGMA